jgi:hypothetical protein
MLLGLPLHSANTVTLRPLPSKKAASTMVYIAAVFGMLKSKRYTHLR